MTWNEVTPLGKKRSPKKKKRPLVWIGLMGLMILVGALIWQAKSLPIFPEPAPVPVPIRFKVPPMSSTSANQTPEPATDPIESVQAFETTPPRVDGTVTQVAEPPEQNDSQTATAETAPPKTAGIIPDPIAAAVSVSKVLQPVPPASASQADLGATAPGPDAPAPYTLQVGSYLTQTYAEDLMAALTKKGYEPFIFEVTDVKQRKWYAVRFGQFETYKRAAQSLSEFKDKENMDGIIRRSVSP